VQLGRIDLIIASFHAFNQCTNRIGNEFPEVFLSFVLQVDVVFKLLRDAVIDLIMQLRDDLEAVFACVDDIDEA